MHAGDLVLRVDRKRALEVRRRLIEHRDVEQNDADPGMRFVQSRPRGDGGRELRDRVGVLEPALGSPDETPAHIARFG